MKPTNTEEERQRPPTHPKSTTAAPESRDAGTNYTSGVPNATSAADPSSNASTYPPPPPPPYPFAVEERAERGVLSSVEKRRQHVRTASGEQWHAAVPGERPPLGGNVPFQRMYNSMATPPAPMSRTSSTASSTDEAKSARQKFQDIARKVRMLNLVAPGNAHTNHGLTSPNGSTSGGSRGHRKTASRAHALLDSIQEATEDDESRSNCGNVFFEGVGGDALTQGESHFSVEATDADRLVAGAIQVEKLFATNDTGSTSSTEELQDADHDGGALPDYEEQVPLRDHNERYGSLDEFSNGGSKYPRRVVKKRTDRYSSKRLLRRIAKMCHPFTLLQALWHTILHSYFVTLSLPAFVAAWVVYYHIGNPNLEFMPGHASVAWWLIFVGRQCITLELARLTQWLLVDKIILGTRVAVKCLGPLPTLYAIQAKGWPIMLALWAIADLFLLHGDNRFQQHWFYFTGISIFKDANSGVYILTSPTYLRMLLSMLVAGLATAGKRTAVAMYFGRRTFSEFKPRLEKILREVVLLSETAELAQEAERISYGVGQTGETLEIDLNRQDSRVQFMDDVSWTTDRNLVKNSGRGNAMDESSDDESEDRHSPANLKRRRSESLNDAMMEKTESGSFRVSDLLENWEEPVNKLDKSLNASINDILKFRRALTFMDERNPFGDAFGPAASRNDVISSAQQVYQRLLKMTPESIMLNCDVFTMLADEDEGATTNLAKRKALRKLFRPDANNELSQLAFIQSCDSLYKKLRFFRASVGNASVIDHALETIIDFLFNFILALALLSLMRFNPWPLLVSVSTLLVSVSFAVGSSASKYIEGILLIAARRPYDLGDRIYMLDPSVLNSNDGLFWSWFIEDINLFQTTVRYAGTNEVATINNGSIANLRIVNANRSPNAVVWFQLPFHISVLEEKRMDRTRVALEKYAHARPRSWHSFSYCRVDEVHVELEKLVVTIGFQHRTSWQDLGRILMDKADLMCYVYQLTKDLGVDYEELPQRDLVYYSGLLKSGGVRNYRKGLVNPLNIQNSVEGEVPIRQSSSAASTRTNDTDSVNRAFLANLRL